MYHARTREDGGPPDQYKLLTQLNYVMTLDTQTGPQNTLFLGTAPGRAKPGDMYLCTYSS